MTRSETIWTATWADAQQILVPPNALPPADLNDATLREIIHVSLGGTRVRVRFSNLFGTAPLRIDAAHVAYAVSPASAAIEPGSDHALSFGGQPGIVIPPGSEGASDPVELAVSPLSNLAVSLHLPHASLPETGHAVSNSTSYHVHGNQTAARDFDNPAKADHWYYLAGVDVDAGSGSAVIVALGDSIADGFRSTIDGNDRWPDVLARRLQSNAGTKSVGVIDAGIGGNQLLHDGIGPSAVARFDRDVLAQPGARWVIVLEGINDLGRLTLAHPVSPGEHAALVAAILAADKDMIDRAHARGLKAIGATIMPDAGNILYHPDAANNADRQAINAWIRAPGHFDGLIDFAALVRDPRDPNRLQARYDSGDHLHPSHAGYRAMAEAIPLELFAR